MSRGRKHGCPTNIRSWLISALDRASVEWVRIYGLTGMTRTLSGETSDGSAGTDIWEEPYVSKRKATLKLEGEIVEDETSGGLRGGPDPAIGGPVWPQPGGGLCGHRPGTEP